jgi:hypothetical protein
MARDRNLTDSISGMALGDLKVYAHVQPEETGVQSRPNEERKKNQLYV